MIKESNIFDSFDNYFKSHYFGDIKESDKILVVAGNKSFSVSGAADKVKVLLESNRSVLFQDFSVNPKIEDAVKGSILATENKIKHVIAIGGGSVLDMAKLIIAINHRTDQAESIIKGERSVENSSIALTCVPTTSGSGSECTHFAVAYIGSNKYSVASPYLYANAVVLDPMLTKSNSPYQLVVNGLDALAQGIESAWAIGSTEVSRAHSFLAIKRAVKYLPQAYKEPTDDVLREMMLAAHFAGKAIDISKTTSAHAFSYGFTSLYGIPHGHAVWLTLPDIFQAHVDCSDDDITDPRGVEFYRDNILEIVDAMGMEIDDLDSQLYRFLSELDIKSDMKLMGASTDYDREIVKNMVNRQRLKNNPVELDTNRIFCLNAKR